MKGREILHDCVAKINEQKLSVVLNYYERNETWRPAQLMILFIMASNLFRKKL